MEALGSSPEGTAALEELRVIEVEFKLQAEELQRAQVATEAAKHRYEHLFKSAPVGLVVLDSIQLILEANVAAAEFLRAPARLLFGVPFSQFLPAADLPKWALFLQRSLPAEFSIRRWGGERGWARLRLLKLDDESLLLAIEDITDLRGALGDRIQQAEPFTGLFRAMAEPAMIVDDRNRRLVEVTDGLCELTGHSRSELLERKAEELFSPGDRGRASLVIEQLASRSSSVVTQLGLLAPRSEAVPVELLASRGGEGTLVLISMRDLRLTADHGLERAKVSGMLHEAERLGTVARLAGGVAHDLNNMLAAMGSTLDGLRTEIRAGGSVAANEAVDDISRATTYGTEVVQSLLRLSRDGAVEKACFDLRDVVRDAVRLLERALPVQVRITLSLPEVPCIIEGERSEWERAIINLGVNGSDAMPGGGGLDIHLERGVAEFHLVVRDTGAGMSEEVRRRAADPFFTTKELGKGTGLGLSQVAQAVRAHEGSIRLESELGRGSEVVLTVPASKPEPVAARSPAAPLAIRRVLLVEDEPIVRKSLARQLKHLGFEVLAVGSGAEALVQLEAQLPEVVLSDLAMPGMDGLTLARRLREKHPTLPIIIMSGNVPEELQPQLVALQIGRLDKPFGEAELRHALGQLVSR